MDERIKQLLKELGQAINESISASTEVNGQIQKIRDEGYDLYVVLDATIGLGRTDDVNRDGGEVRALTAPREVQFRINVQDLQMLRSLGIDPTRKVKVTRRLETRARKPDE
ncbi:MAG TPA: hypothetical protein VMT00_15765 [Thermoanaerobaculia bacterium]|nr:hypothetical protein [Thermoanaerobaculia bacterium]